MAPSHLAHPAAESPLRFLREVSSTVLSKGAITVIGFGASVIVARTLQPSGKGILSTMTATAEIAAAIGTAGTGTALTFLMAQRDSSRQEIASTSTVLALLSALLAGGFVLVSGPVLRQHVLKGLPWLVVAAALLPAAARALAAQSEGIARGLRHILACNAGAVAQTTSYLLILLGLLAFSRLTAATALLALGVSILVSAAIYLRSYCPSEVSLAPSLSLPIASAMLSYGVGYQAISILQFIHYRAALYLVAHFGGTDNAGWYSTAVGLGQLLWNIPAAVSYVLLPWVASADVARRGEGTAKASRLTLAITLLASLLLGLFGHVLIRLAYGEAFLPSVPALRILMPGIVAGGLISVLGTYLMGRGRPRPLIVITGICAGLNILLNLALLPKYGIEGAALASSITYVLASVLLIASVSRDSGVPWLQFVTPSIRDIADLTPKNDVLP